jgi:hypothetical protein
VVAIIGILVLLWCTPSHVHIDAPAGAPAAGDGMLGVPVSIGDVSGGAVGAGGDTDPLSPQGTLVLCGSRAAVGAAVRAPLAL